MNTINDEIETKIRSDLFALQDIGYRDFQSKLIPTIDSELIIGIRTPELRKYAKQLAKTPEASAYLNILPHKYYDENNLHGMLLESIKDYDRAVEAVDAFLPYVDNWATCDMMSLKIFRKHLPELLPKIKKWLSSENTYTIRFGISMLMKYYLEETFSKEYLDMVAAVKSQEYYVNMMIAWYFATALAKQYNETLPYLETQKLSCWTHNKTIQKAIESYRITPSQKTYLKSLKMK